MKETGQYLIKKRSLGGDIHYTRASSWRGVLQAIESAPHFLVTIIEVREAASNRVIPREMWGESGPKE